MPAHAHGSLGSAAPFWAGVFHFAISPLAIAAALGFTAAIVSIDDRSVLLAVGIAAVAAFVAVVWAPASWLPYVAIGPIVSGLLAVSGWRAHRLVVAIIAAISGVAIGIASEPDVRTSGGAFGVSVMVMVIASAGVELFLWIAAQRWGRVADIARRVLGAWVAAIGLLLGALALLGPLPPS